MQLIVRDGSNGPFLSQVLNYARAEGLLKPAELAQIKSKAVLMSLKFADKFYNKYKMHLLEQAAYDVIGVVSLGLQELSEKDPARALTLLQAPEGLVKPFQKGWSMLVTVSKKAGKTSLYGEVAEQLLQSISCPPMPKNGTVISSINRRLSSTAAHSRCNCYNNSFMFVHTLMNLSISA